MTDKINTERGGISVETQNIFPIIKKWLYSEKEIFLREIVSNACDAVTKLRRLISLGQVKDIGGIGAKQARAVDMHLTLVNAVDVDQRIALHGAFPHGT